MTFLFTKRFLVLLSVLMFSALFLLIYLNIKQNRLNDQAGEMVEHTHTVLNRSERLLLLVTQEVMAARGYVLTGDTTYLRPLVESRKQLDSIYNDLVEFVGAIDDRKKQLAEIRALIAKRMKITDSIDELRPVDSIRALRIAQSGSGKMYMDLIRNKINEFNLDEFQSLRQSQLRFDESKQRLETIQVITLFIVTLITSTFLFIFYRFLVAQKAFMREAQFKSIVLESISEAVVLTDVNFRVTAWNQSAQLLYGYTAKEVLGKSITDVFGIPASSSDISIIDQLRRFKKWQGEIVHLHKNGTPLTVLASITMLPFEGADINGSVAVFRDISERKVMEINLHETNQSLEDLLERQLMETRAANVQLRELNKGLKEAREDERKRISRELHDDLGQVLTSARIHLNFLLEEIDIKDQQLKNRFEELIVTLDRSIQWVRNIAIELRPLALEDLGLFQAITTHAERFRKEINVDIEIYNDVPELIIDNEKATHIFRIFQEALNNIAKHAGASLVSVRITLEDDDFIMSIADNGKGFDPGRVTKKSLGLTTIKERSKLLKAQYQIQSSPGRGTEVKLIMPLIDADE